MPTIDDFMKFEFKVAKIVEAADHPNADKLVVLKIDVGETEEIGGANDQSPEQDPSQETEGAIHESPIQDQTPQPKLKQIVAGIKKSYKAEDLVGKQIVVVNNLEPAVLRGVESNGMLLAASDDDGICIVSPERPMKPGSRVK